MKISIEPRKGKDIGLTGEQAKRIVWVLLDPSGNFIYRSPTSTPMHGTEKDRAAVLIPKALRKLGVKGKGSTSTSRKKASSRGSAKTPKATRQKTTRQKLTVDSCRSFLESRGYQVTSEGERYEDQLRAAGWVDNPRRKRRRKNRDSRSSTYYSVAISKAHSLMMKEHNKTDNYADFVGIGYRRMSENPRLYLAHAVAESNAILNSRASASSKKAARQVIKAITDLHPELAQFESRSRSGIRKFNPRKNPARDSKGRFVKRKNPRAMRRLR